jgi:hypothetical protein
MTLTIFSFLFLLSIPVQILLGRHHKKEKRFGPSPTNNYTKGYGNKFWQRKRHNAELRDPEVAAVPATTTTGHAALAPGARDYRPSHDTHMTGSTVAPPHGTAGPLDNHAYNKPVAGGYHTAPTGTYATPATNY